MISNWSRFSYRSEGVSPENMEGDLYRAPGMEKFEIVKVMRGFRVSESRMFRPAEPMEIAQQSQDLMDWEASETTKPM